MEIIVFPSYDRYNNSNLFSRLCYESNALYTWSDLIPIFLRVGIIILLFYVRLRGYNNLFKATE